MDFPFASVTVCPNMEVLSLDQCPQRAIEALVGAMTIFRQIATADPEQWRLLLKHLEIVELRSGELVFEAEQSTAWLCFLLRGQVAVYQGVEPKRIDSITPGEIFGEVFGLMDRPRATLLIADTCCKRSTLVRVDFSIFGELHDVSQVTLPVKLIFYRSIVHSLRWKLEVYRDKHPLHQCAGGFSAVRVFVGQRGTLAELCNLDAQARQLAQLFVQWGAAQIPDIALGTAPAP